jgi:hypothetical protein
MTREGDWKDCHLCGGVHRVIRDVHNEDLDRGIRAFYVGCPEAPTGRIYWTEGPEVPGRGDVG